MSADGDTEFPKVLLKDLLPRDVAAKQLGLDPVDGDQDTVASCEDCQSEPHNSTES